jgi:hypothetical protein
MAESISETIRISDIRCDDTFRISKPVVTDALLQSLKELGMLEKPYLLDDGNGLLPVTCHNRILALGRLEIETVDAFIIKNFDPAVFINNTAIKVRRNEAGPAGKCRAFMIARKFNIYTDHGHFCKRILNVSPDILDPEFAARILNLPEVLKSYIDIKDPGFKIIKDLVALPQNMIEWIDQCLGIMQVRVNVFKIVVDHLFDLGKKNPLAALPVMDAAVADDRQLLDAVSRIRFPEYSQLRERAGNLINSVTSRGVSVEFPEYFESSRFTLNVDVSVRDSAEDIRRRLNGIDAGKLVELASLLK